MTALDSIKGGWSSFRTICNDLVIPAINLRTPIQGDLILFREIKGGIEVNLDINALQALIDKAVKAAYG
jgi:hypothetical protein